MSRVFSLWRTPLPSGQSAWAQQYDPKVNFWAQAWKYHRLYPIALVLSDDCENALLYSGFSPSKQLHQQSFPVFNTLFFHCIYQFFFFFAFHVSLNLSWKIRGKKKREESSKFYLTEWQSSHWLQWVHLLLCFTLNQECAFEANLIITTYCALVDIMKWS